MATEVHLGDVQKRPPTPFPSGQDGQESSYLLDEQNILESISLPGKQEPIESIPLPGELENFESIPLPDEQKGNLDANSSSGKALISEEEKGDRKHFSKEDKLNVKPSCERPKTASLAQPSKRFASRSYTLPANTGSKIECKVLDIDNLPKQSKWDTFKNKIYLSSPLGGARRMTTMKGSKCCAHLDNEASTSQDHDYSTIEGLDLGGLPPMSNKSRKLFSWSNFMQRVHGKKGKEVLETKNEEELEATEKVQKKFSMAWFQKKFLPGKGSSSATGFGNGEDSKEVADEEVKNVDLGDSNGQGPTVKEVL